MTRGGEGRSASHSKEAIEKMQGRQNTKGKHWKWLEEFKEKIKGKSNAEGCKWFEESKEKIQGNKNASGERSKEFCENMQGNQNAKGYKHSKKQIENNSKNNSMKNSKTVLKFRITCLKKAIKKLEERGK